MTTRNEQIAELLAQASAPLRRAVELAEEGDDESVEIMVVKLHVTLTKAIEKMGPTP